MTLRRRVELYLKRTRTTPTRFGREVLNDPNFVFQLRKGRRVGRSAARRVEDWLDGQSRNG